MIIFWMIRLWTVYLIHSEPWSCEKSWRSQNLFAQKCWWQPTSALVRRSTCTWKSKRRTGFYVAWVNTPGLDRQSYTPKLEGDAPTLMMEFISYTDGDEYSSKPTHPVGKWFFYEQVLKVPVYIIFNPDGGLVECYRLKNERYTLEQPDENRWNWISEMNLFLGTRQNTRDGRTGYWLRWWTADGELLPWASETIDAKDQALQEKDQTLADLRDREQQLVALLRSQGLDPDTTP